MNSIHWTEARPAGCGGPVGGPGGSVGGRRLFALDDLEGGQLAIEDLGGHDGHAGLLPVALDLEMK